MKKVLIVTSYSSIPIHSLPMTRDTIHVPCPMLSQCCSCRCRRTFPTHSRTDQSDMAESEYSNNRAFQITVHKNPLVSIGTGLRNRSELQLKPACKNLDFSRSGYTSSYILGY